MQESPKSIKDDLTLLRREMKRAKKDWVAQTQKLELLVKTQKGDIRKKRTQLKKKTMSLSQLKKESASKIKELKSKAGKIEKPQEKYRERHVSKDLLNRKEAELHQLKVQVEYKNKLLASRDLELDSYKKVTEEKIFRLDARVKELEGKLSESAPAA